MYRLSLVILWLGLTVALPAQSPHGPDLKMDCGACHTSDSWEIPFESWNFTEPGQPKRSNTTGWVIADDTLRFNHYRTEFPLLGQHAAVDCRACHETLVFSEAETECLSCHTDMHRTTVGSDCARCHTTDNWLIDDITGLHQDNGFPLLGAHATADCKACHISESALEFPRIGNDCINCHLDDFSATTNPNHPDAGFPTDCTQCHQADGFDWAAEPIDHSFFPLTLGHDIPDCARCHTGGAFSETPTDCVACHEADFANALNPDHQGADFPTNCAACHTTDPGWRPATFDIHDEYYPLNGAHTVVDCAACHQGDYNNTPNTCAGCHTDDYNSTTEPDHQDALFPTDCESCHTETAWTPSTFNHDDYYVFTGAHIPIANDCAACHHGDYDNTPNTCAGCHLEDHSGTTNPNHVALDIPTDCESCHTTEPDWMPATFDIHDDYYVLNGAHAIIANDCAACHNGDYNNTPITCYGCHTEDYNNTGNPNHAAAQFSTDCQTCHTEDAWVPSTFDHDGQYFPIYSGAHQGEWDQCVDCHNAIPNYSIFTCTNCHTNPETDEEHEDVGGYIYESNACLACHPTGDSDNIFDHNLTAFPLTGAHATVNCNECHVAGYTGTPTECAACHTPDFNQTANPAHMPLGISTDCAACHTTGPGWSPATFDMHDDVYALNGAHAMIADDCAACHNGDYNNTPNTCAGCHTDDYNQTTDPDHETAQFPVDCESCHSETAWTPSSFNHDNFYPLTGGHNLIADDCAACHQGDYDNTPNTCAGCHTEDHSQTTNPNHVALGLPVDCESCHTTEPDWMPATFDIHDDFYALNGAHAVIANDCAACHNGDYVSTPNTCYGCHSEDYNNTLDPNHVSAQFSTDCATCHTENAWIPSTFDHDGQYFPIYSGAHQGEWNECVDCHTGMPNYAIVTCTNCHTNPETDEAHEGVGGYVYESNACLACHPTGDADNIFDHNTTGFGLTGAHTTVNCLDCHAAGYAGTPTECAACHTPDYNQTANPDHNALGFSTDCASCHTTEPGWSPAAFDTHDDFYALNGAHAMIANDCAACHNGDYNNTPNTCAGCHADDYNQTTDPDHAAAQFPVDCESCHSETAWAPSSFDHDNYYVLTGAHIPIADDCAACHQGDYDNTPNTCAGCHTEDHSQTTNPNHVALGLPVDCESCHTTEPDWMPATFDIHDDYYVVNGAHVIIANDCAACHNGDYNNTPNTCYGCHTEDYNNTLDPNHAAAQFSTDCQMCHTENAWVPSTFDHDGQYFPIYSGAHEGEWAACTDCHANLSNYAIVTCTNCHTNPETDEAHEGVGGYVYESNACLACHPTGDADNIFDHNTTGFGLTGAHTTVNCLDCHAAGYAGTPTECAACHTPDYNQTANPDHNALGFSTDCASCHTTEPGWSPAAFDTHDDFYALNGAHAMIANDCAACHQGDYVNTPNTCAGCHTDDYNQTTDPDHAAAQFPTDCQDCHTESSWSPSTFDHSGFYPLTGAHVPIANDCAICHNGDYVNTPNTCAGCHTEDYNQSINPDHQALGLPVDCESCHTTEPDWMPASFAIHDNYYPLNGAHAAIANDCAACHNGDYVNTPNTCYGCHTADYNQTTNPDHAAAQLSTDCASCHTEDTWVPSTFDHDSFYPILGAHAAIANDCNACHNGDYVNTPNTCYGCHADDYNQTNDPNHVSAGFPTDCESCHSQNAWVPSTFDHDGMYFPIYSGRHDGEWNDCTDCHTTAGSFSVFSCIDCHEHDDPVDLADKHSEVPGYTYESNACYACHPTGQAD